MFGFGHGKHHNTTFPTTTTTSHRRKWYQRPNQNRRAGGFKAALHNPNTTSSGRGHAKHELRVMGRGRDARVPFSVRVKRALGIRSRGHHHSVMTR